MNLSQSPGCGHWWDQSNVCTGAHVFWCPPCERKAKAERREAMAYVAWWPIGWGP